ncbi:hypothetical protein ACW5EG_00310 [Luteimonas sp. A611]
MRTCQTLAFLLLVGGIAGIALARDGSFAVGVQVVDRRPASALLDAIPVPPQARVFDSNGHVRSYVWPGTPAAAAAFFEVELPQRGYRALARRGQGQAMQQVWGDGRGRVVLQLEQALGSADLTRIRISVARATGLPAAMPGEAPGPITSAGAP